jgi:hypothetical protein
MRKAIIGAAAGLGALLSLVAVSAQAPSITTDQASYELDPASNSVDVVVTATGLPAACEGLEINLRITATADGSGTANASRPALVTGGSASATIPYPGIAGVGTRYAGASNRTGEECLDTSPIVGSSFTVTQPGGPTETPTSEPTTPVPTDTPTSEPTDTPTGTATGTGTATATATSGTATPAPPATGVGSSNDGGVSFALIALGAIAALAVGSAGYVLRARR